MCARVPHARMHVCVRKCVCVCLNVNVCVCVSVCCECVCSCMCLRICFTLMKMVLYIAQLCSYICRYRYCCCSYSWSSFLTEQLEKLLLKFNVDHTVAGAAIDTMEKVNYL